MTDAHYATEHAATLGGVQIAKAYDASIVADRRVDDREFTAIVAAYGVVDDEGDMIMPGAFAAEIDRIRNAGETIPVVWDHDHKTLESYIGEVVEIADLSPGDSRLPGHLFDKGGLWVRAKVDEDPAAQKAYGLMKGGRIRQFSFVALGGSYEPASHGRRISEVRDLVEVGPTLRGMNTSTALLSIKSQTTTTAEAQPSTEATDTAPDAASAAPVAAPSDADRARYLRLLSLTQ